MKLGPVTAFFARLLKRREGDAQGGPPAAVCPSAAELIDPQAIASIEGLDLLSKRIVDGFLVGRHRSTHKGGCCEFAQHRPYSPGDELRLIDWQIYARSDRYFVRQFEEETNAQALLVLDSSGSMKFGMSTPSKFEVARRAAACLARLLLRQRDAVGLSLVNDRSIEYVPPREKPLHLQTILKSLATAEVAGETQLARQLHECGSRLRRRGLVLIFSDCFDDVEEMGRSLRSLRARGIDTVVFHVLAPEELTFQFRYWSSFQSLEDASHRIDIDPAIIRDEYLKRFQRFLSELRTTITAAGGDYVRIRTDAELGTVLAHYLRRRVAAAPPELHSDKLVGEVSS